MKVTSVNGLSERMRFGIFEHVFSAGDREVAGVLIGEYFDEGDLWIKDHIRAEDADERAAAVTFTHDSWDKILRIKDSQHPDSQIIGWYHSHPGYGLFLSGDDLFIHQNFFPAWWQIAYVVDPVNHEGGLFVWQDGEMVEFERHEASLDGPGRILRDPRGRAPTNGAANGGQLLASLPRSLVLGGGIMVIVVIVLLIALVALGNGDSPEDTAVVQPESQSRSTEEANQESGVGKVIDQFPDNKKQPRYVPTAPVTPIDPNRKTPSGSGVPGGSSQDSDSSGSSGGSKEGAVGPGQ